MMPLCWSILLLCLSANAENAVLFRDSGESVTLQCSTAECPNRNENFLGLYLNHIFEKPEKVLYYYQKESNDTVTPSEKFKNRIKTNGSLKSITITISNVTIEDAGLYECSYRNVLEDIKVTCKVYTLSVRGALCARPKEWKLVESTTLTLEERGDKKGPPLALIIMATSAISMLVTMIFTLLIFLKVKKWTRNRRRRRAAAPPASSDYVYEVMTKNGRPRSEAPGNSPPSPYDLA